MSNGQQMQILTEYAYMGKSNPLLEKSYVFAVQIVQLCRFLQKHEKEFVLSAQLLKSGTSIGANIEEATQAQSKSDFISKLSIALKEAHESRFWLRLLRETNLVEASKAEMLLMDLQEIIRMLVASIRTAKGK
jgi:four helix bundle protein